MIVKDIFKRSVMPTTKVLDKIYDILNEQGFNLTIERVPGESNSRFVIDEDIHFIAVKTANRITVVVDMIVSPYSGVVVVKITANDKIMYTSIDLERKSNVGRTTFAKQDVITMGGEEMLAIRYFFETYDVFAVAKTFLDFADFESMEIDDLENMTDVHTLTISRDLVITYKPGIGEYASMLNKGFVANDTIISPIVHIESINNRRLFFIVSMDDFMMLIGFTEKYGDSGKYLNIFVRSLTELMDEQHGHDPSHSAGYYIDALRKWNEELNGEECSIDDR